MARARASAHNRRVPGLQELLQGDHGPLWGEHESKFRNSLRRRAPPQSLPLSLALISRYAAPALAQDAESKAEAATKMETMVVTGSRIKRAEIEGPAAVTIVTSAGCLTGLSRNRQPYEFGPDSAFCQAILTRVDRLSSPGSTQGGQISEIRSGPINRALLATKGIDASVTYRFDTDRLGAFTGTTGWSHTLEQKTREFETDPIISYRDRLTNFDFRSRVRSTLNWQVGPRCSRCAWAACRTGRKPAALHRLPSETSMSASS